MKWVVIRIHECFITKETEKAVRVRLPRWLEGVSGSFWVPKGCVKHDFGSAELCMPESLRVEISYRKEDDFGEFGEWQKREYSPEVIKTQMFEVDGQIPSEGDTRFACKAPVLEPIHVDPLPELIDD